MYNDESNIELWYVIPYEFRVWM